MILFSKKLQQYSPISVWICIAEKYFYGIRQLKIQQRKMEEWLDFCAELWYFARASVSRNFFETNLPFQMLCTCLVRVTQSNQYSIGSCVECCRVDNSVSMLPCLYFSLICANVIKSNERMEWNRMQFHAIEIRRINFIWTEYLRWASKPYFRMCGQFTYRERIQTIFITRKKRQQ